MPSPIHLLKMLFVYLPAQVKETDVWQLIRDNCVLSTNKHINRINSGNNQIITT